MGMVRSGFLAAALLGLAGCAGSGSVESVAAPHPVAPASADFLTQSAQFADLQRAALSADYQAFARDLHAGDAASVVSTLNGAFGGEPFDLYTVEAETDGNDHRRLVELRGPRDRLYLYLALDRSAGGWNAADYEIGRDRGAVGRRL